MKTQSTTAAPSLAGIGPSATVATPAAATDPASTGTTRRRIGAGSGAGAPPARADLAAAPPAGPRPALRAPAAALGNLGRAVANSGAGVAVGLAVRGTADAVVPPAVRQAAGHFLTALRRESPGAAQARSALQGSLQALQTLPAGAGQDQVRDAQLQAHDDLRRYAGTTSSYADGLVPVLHKAAVVGVAGAGMAFGVGRSGGVALADLALREQRGQPSSLGLLAPQIPPGRPGTDAVVNAAAQAALGAAVGGIGSFVGQSLVGQLVNQITRRQAPVDVKAAVPDEMVALMNQLQPGAGDALRRSAQDEQGRNTNVASQRNVAVGQFFFDAANAVRTGMQGNTALGVSGNLLAGTAVSSCAGAAIGTTIAVNSALAKVSVPDMAALRQAADAGGGADALAGLPRHDVPLFYTQHAQRPDRLFVNPVADPTPGRQALMGDAQGPMPAPSPSRLAGAVNAASSMAMRGAAMLQATVGTAVVSAMTPAFAASMPTEQSATAARAIGAAIGIHTAIQPWFGELAGGIAGRDAQIVSARQTAVDDAARRARERSAPAPTAPIAAPAPAPAPAAPAPAALPVPAAVPSVDIELGALRSRSGAAGS